MLLVGAQGDAQPPFDGLPKGRQKTVRWSRRNRKIARAVATEMAGNLGELQGWIEKAHLATGPDDPPDRLRFKAMADALTGIECSLQKMQDKYSAMFSDSRDHVVTRRWLAHQPMHIPSGLSSDMNLYNGLGHWIHRHHQRKNYMLQPMEPHAIPMVLCQQPGQAMGPAWVRDEHLEPFRGHRMMADNRTFARDMGVLPWGHNCGPEEIMPNGCQMAWDITGHHKLHRPDVIRQRDFHGMPRFQEPLGRVECRAWRPLRGGGGDQRKSKQYILIACATLGACQLT